MSLIHLNQAVSVFLLVFNFSESAKILGYFPVPSISHQVVFRPLIQELAKRGHQLVIVTPDPAFPENGTPENITEIDVHEISYKIWSDIFVNSVDGQTTPFDSLKLGIEAMNVIVEMQIKNEKFWELIQNRDHFDLLLVETCVRQDLILSYLFKAPVIQVSSFGALNWNNEAMGVPNHPFLYPEMIRHRIYNLNFWEKLEALYIEVNMAYLMWSRQEYEDKMLRKLFGENTPSVAELTKNVDMMFLNINPIWEGNRAIPPGVIYMGSLHNVNKKPKTLPEELNLFMNASKNGVIYMSLGTNVKPSLWPKETIQIFLNVFSSLPYDVLLKWDKDNVEGKPENVRLFKWMPQFDLLRHPKIKLFITQAGLQSTDEAILAGVPLLAFPVLVDQWHNAERYVKFKIGIQLDIKTVTEDILKNSIHELINNASYRNNVNKLRELQQDQPQNSLERAIWWTEYVLRHGGAKHLRAPAAGLPWTEFLALDVVSALVLFAATIVAISIFVFKYLIKIFLKYCIIKKKSD